MKLSGLFSPLKCTDKRCTVSGPRILHDMFVGFSWTWLLGVVVCGLLFLTNRSFRGEVDDELGLAFGIVAGVAVLLAGLWMVLRRRTLDFETGRFEVGAGVVHANELSLVLLTAKLEQVRNRVQRGRVWEVKIMVGEREPVIEWIDELDRRSPLKRLTGQLVVRHFGELPDSVNAETHTVITVWESPMEARRLAKRIAEAADVPLVTATRGLTVERPEELSLTLTERIRQNTAAAGDQSLPEPSYSALGERTYKWSYTSWGRLIVATIVVIAIGVSLSMFAAIYMDSGGFDLIGFDSRSAGTGRTWMEVMASDDGAVGFGRSSRPNVINYMIVGGVLALLALALWWQRKGPPFTWHQLTVSSDHAIRRTSLPLPHTDTVAGNQLDCLIAVGASPTRSVPGGLYLLTQDDLQFVPAAGEQREAISRILAHALGSARS